MVNKDRYIHIIADAILKKCDSQYPAEMVTYPLIKVLKIDLNTLITHLESEALPGVRVTWAASYRWHLLRAGTYEA